LLVVYSSHSLLIYQISSVFPSALSFDRYKFVVQVYIGERRDQGVRVGSRQFWDAGTDNMASETFTNDHIYAVATAFAVYLY